MTEETDMSNSNGFLPDLQRIGSRDQLLDPLDSIIWDHWRNEASSFLYICHYLTKVNGVTHVGRGCTVCAALKGGFL